MQGLVVGSRVKFESVGSDGSTKTREGTVEFIAKDKGGNPYFKLACLEGGFRPIPLSQVVGQIDVLAYPTPEGWDKV